MVVCSPEKVVPRPEYVSARFCRSETYPVAEPLIVFPIVVDA